MHGGDRRSLSTATVTDEGHELMAALNTALLISEATVLSRRAYQVQQDPAVQKACREAIRDLATAGRSAAAAFYEARSAWARTGVGGFASAT